MLDPEYVGGRSPPVLFMGATRGGFYFGFSNKRKISTYFKGAPRGDITDISVINDLITFFGCGHTYKLKSNACIFTGAKPRTK